MVTYSTYFSPHLLPNPLRLAKPERAFRREENQRIRRNYYMVMVMDMPHDMVLEIFSWLPAKSIFKFKCIDKFCNTLSSPEDSYFILKQSQNALLMDDYCFFLQPNWVVTYGAKFEFYHLNLKDTASGISQGFFHFLEHYPNCRIIASSKGLILGRGDTDLFICNPVTQTWLPILTPEYMEKYPYADLNVTLECNVEDSNDFMLFLFEGQDEWASDQYYDVRFYSVKEGIWKSMESNFFYGGRNMRFDMHVYYRKALHFISDCFSYLSKGSPYYRPYIMAYNVEDGSSRMIRIPKEARIGSCDFTWQMGIYKWEKSTSSDQSICLVRLSENVFTIWVLSDYEIGTWRRILKIGVKAMGLKEEDPIVVTGFIVMNGDKLIFTTRKKIYGYGLRQENFMKFEEICEHGFGCYNVTFDAYSDTLRPCGHNYERLPIMQQH